MSPHAHLVLGLWEGGKRPSLLVCGDQLPCQKADKGQCSPSPTDIAGIHAGGEALLSSHTYSLWFAPGGEGLSLAQNGKGGPRP